MPLAVNSPEAKIVISAVKVSLVEMALWDIHRVFGRTPPENFVKLNSIFKNGTHAIASSFILGCCLIDAAGNYTIPSPKEKPGKRPESNSYKAFTTFCTEFLKRDYDPDVLYSAMRCGLAHAYSTGSSDPKVLESYHLTHNQIGAHLRADIGEPRVRYVNAQNFVVDLTDAFCDFFMAVESNARLSSGEHVQPYSEWAEICGFMAVKEGSSLTGVAPTAAHLWKGKGTPALRYPLNGTGAAQLRHVPDGSATNSTLCIAASGWSGFSNLGVSSSSWTLQAPIATRGAVSVGNNFEIVSDRFIKKKLRGGR